MDSIDESNPGGNGKTHESKPDPFDLTRLKLSQDFAASIGLKKAQLTIPVRKPAKEWFIQCNADPGYRIETNVIELKEERETYLVSPELWPSLGMESTFGPRALITAQNTQGTTFIWSIRLPGPDGKIDDWNRSAMEAAMMAMEGKWVRVQANMSLGAYDVTIATTEKKPIWPAESFQDLLRVAFKGRLIESTDHPVLRRLRGEA